jgi:EAL and modified HD-GYP domain-containing signal transduction protein
MVGTNHLRGWLVLLLMSDVQDKPHELTKIALVRAFFCEYLARSNHISSPETSFMTGLVSVMDALMDMPMETIIEEVQLTGEIRTALLNQSGTLGSILKSAIAYERGDFEPVLDAGIRAETASAAYLKAISQTDLLWENLKRMK